jgi:hypothetical protein
MAETKDEICWFRNFGPQGESALYVSLRTQDLHFFKFTRNLMPCDKWVPVLGVPGDKWVHVLGVPGDKWVHVLWVPGDKWVPVLGVPGDKWVPVLGVPAINGSLYWGAPR